MEIERCSNETAFCLLSAIASTVREGENIPEAALTSVFSSATVDVNRSRC